ncbi:hypothetical protein [Wenzhouxiangella marina]|uniref:Uncharacterized protein n=1 Tax=Wenzhouxiangella marina TaxID=1579979 RepID=A0A0K0XUG4_9GAMM|nr:hypothetical protein [Wenzhouxiangella marina]AKS41262.1 hypothetical protein WM2015_881 [Wenzhouxiangella marina]MBB6086989.1 hypothetical protein [Wenzhouxiangella marina]
MTVGPIRSIVLGSGAFVVLLAISQLAASELQADGTYHENWLEGVSSILAWFLPGLISGWVLRERPIMVGCILGLLVLVIEFLVVTLIDGSDWAFAALLAFPGATLFGVFSVVVFTYAGSRLRQLHHSERSNAA